MRAALAVCVLLGVAGLAHGAQPASAWAGRRIYQILTDRFAKGPMAPTPAPAPPGTVTLIYQNTAWSQCYLHYDAGSGWNGVPGAAMPCGYGSEYPCSGGWYVGTVLHASSVTFVTTDGQGQWDNNDGANYEITYPGTWLLSNGNLRPLTSSLTAAMLNVTNKKQQKPKKKLGGSPTPPCNYNTYCGGTFSGVEEHLDYITGMGFDAIWISPVPLNYDISPTNQGYHGYWALDWFKINPHFGTPEQLKSFVSAAHAKGVWVMVDLVHNHVAPVGTAYGLVNPFNSSDHYHPVCQVNNYQCETQEILHCRLADLPDLNQDNPYVTQQLLAYTQWLLNEFQFDGIRMDTVMYVKNQYWTVLSSQVNSYIVGEVDLGGSAGLACNVNYASNGVDATLNYPLYHVLRAVFREGQSMYGLGTAYRDQQQFPHPNWEVNFLDNHDNSRFLCGNDNIVPQYKSALAHMFFQPGIPCVYQGTEQLYDGCAGPANDNREALWPSGYNTNTDMYTFLATLSSAHRRYQTYAAEYLERWRDQSFYCYVRGSIVVATTNGNDAQTRTVPNLPLSGSQQLCDLFKPSDCVPGSVNMTLTIPAGGEPKVWFIH